MYLHCENLFQKNRLLTGKGVVCIIDTFRLKSMSVVGRRFLLVTKQENMHKKAGGGLFGFFKTETGRKLVFYAAGTTTAGLFVGNFLPHTFGLQHYRDFVQCYQ